LSQISANRIEPFGRTATSSTMTEPSVKKRTFRPDIEGLRAFAVVLVVLDHLNLWPSGGFIGVDVFFTISGFLITGLIVDEIGRTGRFSFKRFYIRRARRILPAALTVLLATWIAAKIVFFGPRVSDTVHDIWWCLGFAANINFARGGTDYFQTYQAPSLVQHYWSLAVEEQFYVVWPVLLLVVSLAARRLTGALATRWVLAISVSAVAGSFGYCVWQTATNPAASYFSTTGRAWELGVGAVVALVARQGVRVPDQLSGPLCFLGLAGIVGSAMILDEHSTFPGPAAAFPVLASGVVLFSGCGVSRFTSVWHVPVTNLLSRYIGRVSFSLYLWHWPTILIVSVLVSPDAGIYYPLTICAMVTLTLFSYYAIELPFHRPPRSKPVAPRVSAARHGTGRSRMVTVTGRRRATVIVALVVCTLTLWVLRPAPPAPPAAVLGVGAGGATDPTVPGRPQTAALQTDIATALRASSWPTLTPSLTDVVANKTTPDGMSNCVGPELPPADLCTWGDPDAPKTALLVGDSVSQAYMQVMKHFVEDDITGWKIRFIGQAGCPFLDIRIDNPVEWVAKACPLRKQAAVDLILSTHPDVVIVTNVYAAHTDTDTNQEVSPREWQSGLSRYVDKFRAATKKVVFLAPPPTDADIVKCYTAFSVPATCISHVTSAWQQWATADKAVSSSINGIYIDSTPWFCVSDLCPAFVGDVATKKDLVHITPEYADMIAPAAFESFALTGVFT
jgi:peptidoglycan/LPS O-acetylase OafA/YrhL